MRVSPTLEPNDYCRIEIDKDKLFGKRQKDGPVRYLQAILAIDYYNLVKESNEKDNLITYTFTN